MPQDTNSGRAANEAGRCIARQIGEYLGVSLPSNSNECSFQSKQTVIKSASYGNTKFGITKSMLNHIEQVIVAFQPAKNSAFHLYCVPINSIIDFGTETRSKGASKDKILNFRVNQSIEYGHKLGEISI